MINKRVSARHVNKKHGGAELTCIKLSFWVG